VNRFISKGLSRDKSLKTAQMTKHQFYYTPVKSGKRGRPPSTHTLRLLNGSWQSVLNEELELEMRSIDANPDLSCGAVRMTDQLQLKGYKVNHKATSNNPSWAANFLFFMSLKNHEPLWSFGTVVFLLMRSLYRVLSHLFSRCF